MTKLFYNLKHNKWLLTFFVLALVVFVFDVSLIVFDCVQLASTANNSASLSNLFVFFNIFVIVLNCAYVIFLILYLVLRKK